MAASFVFLDPDSAVRAPTDIVDECKACECSLLQVVALSAFVPVLLALEARVVSTVLARDLRFALVISPDLLLALQVWAENEIWVQIDLSRKPQPCQTLLV